MHDGRFDTLRDVLDFYDDGVEETPNISPEMYQDNGNPGIPMTEDEKTKIIAFLKTLSDIDFTLDEHILNSNNLIHHHYQYRAKVC